MSEINTSEVIQVGDGINAARTNIKSGANSLEVDSGTIAVLLSDLLIEVRLLREMIESNL